MSLLAALALLFAPSHAADVDPFEVSGSLSSGTGSLQGEAGHVTGEGLSLGLWFGVAHDPLELIQANDEVVDGVSWLVPLTLHGGWTFKDIARIDLFIPSYAYAVTPMNDFAGPAFGDVQIGGQVQAYSLGDILGLSFAARLGLPSGTPTAHTARKFHGRLSAIVGGEHDVGFGYTANLGLTLAPSDTIIDVDMASTFDALGGVYYRVHPLFRLGAEVDGHVGFLGANGAANSLGTAHGYGQLTLDNGLSAVIGGGGGISAGIGAPEWRLFAGISWRMVDRDADDDGILDKDDSCELEAEDMDGFEDGDGCPELDNDEDGVPDADDACALDPEDADGFDDADGCPDPDNDGDGILDVEDACPEEAGLVERKGCPIRDKDGDTVEDDIDACPDVSGPLATSGCPDVDGDLVPDHRDSCPDEPKPEAEDPATSDGCPKRVFVAAGAKAIKILDKVFFKTGSSSIDPRSYDLLTEVATVIIDTPTITLLEVGGHTDSVGSQSGNQRLSQRRADSVRTYLIRKEVAAERLTAVGYGPDSPLDTNNTEAGRATNRRVEFKILAQEGVETEEPAAEE